MLNAPLPPDITVTDRLQMVISEWKGAQNGQPLKTLYQDCLDLVGSEVQLLPRRIISVPELDSANLEQALKRSRLPLEYAVDTVGRFEAAMVPVLRETGSATGFFFVYEEDLHVEQQVALFAHVVGHLILNDQAHLKERALPLDPDSGEIHIDRLAELRYLDISNNRNYVDRQVLESFPKLTRLIEQPEESPIDLNRATSDLEHMLRKQGWVNNFVQIRRQYTQGRIIPNSRQRGKRQVVDALLRSDISLPIAVVQAQRPTETLQEAVARTRLAAQQLSVPFCYILTTQQEVVELHWLNGELSAPQLRATLPSRDELRTRWLTALQLTDTLEKNTLIYPYDLTQTPRYYQEAATNRAVIATLQARKGLRPRRILLTLATGTGKTQVAFQILWKLKKNYAVRNVLFLADRGYLLDQAQNNTFGPFGDAIVRGSGEIDTAHDILFGSYQWLTMLQDGVERYKGYPADYFDVIVIDECHRGSADEDSNWRKVLEHFTEAVQIGLTATPLETKDVQTNKYFGDPVYIYSLSQGINDGYLAPYNVRRVVIEKTTPTTQTPLVANQPVETLDQQIVMQTGQAMRQYTQVIAEHLAQYLQLQTDPRQHKTIVFCVDNSHADQMRLALEKTCAAWARSGDIVRIVDDDGLEGKRALNSFCTVRERQPVIVTTARLLTTGVDVPTCKNIVLARGVGSIVEFKQIIGRGTRIFDQEKTWFTIIDYAGAIKHFSDPKFDGDPTSVQREYLPPSQPARVSDNADASMDSESSIPTSPATSSEPGTDGTNQQQPWELPLSQLSEEPTLTDDHSNNTISPTAHDPSVVNDGVLPYEAKTSIPDAPSSPLAASTESTPSTEQLGQHEQTSSQPPEQQPEPIEAYHSIAATEQAGRAARSAIPDNRAAPEAPPTWPAEPTRQPKKAPEVTVDKANGERITISGEYVYILDARGTLRQESTTEFTQNALKDMVKTPQDLFAYWTNKQERQLLIEQLASEVVGLDALAKTLQLPAVDHYDLLLHVLFQLPTITRTERVKRLREKHSTFFQRFEPNPLATELLNVILAKYIQGDAPDVSDLDLLKVPPLSARTSMEWAQAFRQATPKTRLSATLKELQQLLYST